MQTERLFYQDPFLRTCRSRVEECRPAKKGFEVRLDRTVFYPEGGGQPCDLGTLGDASVTDVREKDGEIWHAVDRAMPEGSEAVCAIDWERRFDLMQHHAGEHIVSGLIHGTYGYNNVGFHMGADTITVDLDGELSPEELLEIEKRANRYVTEDHEVRILYPDRAELEKLPYRSKKEIEGEVRLVEWPGADLCACCGLHVARSGQIGPIVLVSSERFRGGVRIEMLCGGRALAWLNCLREQNRRISSLLSAKWTNVADAVEKLEKEYQQARFALGGMEREKVAGIVARLRGAGDSLLFDASLSPDVARLLVNDGMEVCGGVCALFVGDDKSGYRYLIGEKGGDLRAFVKEMNQALGGRGGGKPFFVQGSVRAARAAIEEYFKNHERNTRV